MTAEEEAKRLVECARYLEDLAADNAENSHRHRTLREGALALRDKAAFRGRKRCTLGQCHRPAAVCQDCYAAMVRVAEGVERPQKESINA